MTPSDKLPSNIFRKQATRKIQRSDLNLLIEMLRASDASLVKFGQEISKYPAILKQLLRAANSSLTGSAVEISDPAHATLFLGSRRVEYLLNFLPSELIEEDLETNESDG
jgi:HD-like signal output (HDOD) protein